MSEMIEFHAEYDKVLNLIRCPSGQPTPPPGYYQIVDGLLEPFDPQPGEWPSGPVYRIGAAQKE